MADTCRCHLPLDPPLGLPTGCWWPRRDAEPGPNVQAVALCGADPSFLRRVREAGGWRSRGHGANHPGSTPPAPWSEVGSCWAGVDHAVVDVTHADGERHELRAAAIGFARRGWPVLRGTYPDAGSGRRWLGRPAAVGLRPVDDDWARAHTTRAEQADRWWATAPYRLIVAGGHGVDCLELPSSSAACRLPGLLHDAGVRTPAMETPVGTVVLFVRTPAGRPPLVESATLRSRGSWIGVPPTRTAAAARGPTCYRWLPGRSPTDLRWQLPELAAVREVLIAAVRG